ncbi:MAG: hypothetical protein IJ503_04175 [Akkermansia sp.]|nr:hypothetical protein [Akkermansia sp.]
MKSTIYLHGLLSILLFTGCSVEKRLESARQDLLEEYRTMPDWKKLPARTISWQQALIMLENNLELQRAQLNILEARQQRDRVYRDFIPMVDIGHYYSTALMRGNDSIPSSSSFDVNILFSIPALTQLPIDHYTRSLTLFKAEKDLELKRRELTAKLWKIFREHDLKRRRYAVEDSAPENRLADRQLKAEERELEQRDSTRELCALLNDYGARWQPMTGSLPEISWQEYRKLATVPDELTQTMMALTLESARLQKLGTGLQYLPDIHINFYSPTLFSTSGGTTEGFFSGGQDVRMNLNIYQELDTRMETWSQWAMAKENYKLVQQELTHQMHEYRHKMQLLLDSWKSYDRWKRSTVSYMQFRSQQGECEPEAIAELHNEEVALQKEILEQEQKNIERECALIQEYGLPQLPIAPTINHKT